MKEQPLIETINLCKNFRPTRALRDVSLKVYGGEITGLIGENGSRKSTISSIISGMQLPTSGSMLFKGKPYAPRTMIEAGRVGIGTVVQEQRYITGISIARNIFLGVENQFLKWGVISKKAMYTAATAVLERIGMEEVDPSMLIDRLEIHDRKLIEICRVLATAPEILIIDETTTALSHHGREITYSIMRSMKDAGKAKEKSIT